MDREGQPTKSDCRPRECGDAFEPIILGAVPHVVDQLWLPRVLKYRSMWDTCRGGTSEQGRVARSFEEECDWAYPSKSRAGPSEQE
jgi:hypothetical protein